MLQRVAECSIMLWTRYFFWCVAVCCSVLQCVAVCVVISRPCLQLTIDIGALQRVAECIMVLFTRH